MHKSLKMMQQFIKLYHFCLTFYIIQMNEQTNQNTSCSMTGILGILIQVGLGVLSFSVLIIKRIRQNPQRAWKIWIFDTSKQLISQVIAHFINLTISIALTKNDESSDECLWYFMTNILDNTFGVLICLLCLRGVQYSLTRRNKLEYISGNYYKKQKLTVQIQIMDFNKGQVKDSIQVERTSVDQKNRKLKTHQHQMVEQTAGQHQSQKQQASEQHQSQKQKKLQKRQLQQQKQGNNARNTQSILKYKINYQAWLVQLLIWISIVVIGKILLFSLEYSIRNPLKDFSFLIMGWIQSYPVLELFVVIVLVPVVMNGLAFWIQDNFLMKKENKSSDNQTPLVEEASTNREEPSIL